MARSSNSEMSGTVGQPERPIQRSESELGRNEELPFGAYGHEFQGFPPARDGACDIEVDSFPLRKELPNSVPSMKVPR